MNDLIKQLSLLNGTSGNEETVRNFIKEQLPSDCETSTDNLGNLIVFKKGKKTSKNKVMVAAHMDEVGFIVTDIDSDGYISFDAVGGILSSVVLGRQVQFANGVTGIIGAKPIHLLEGDEKENQPKISSLFIDIGAKDKEDAEKNVSKGDFCYFKSEFLEFGNGFLKGKALDDRIGCAIMIELINKPLEYDTYFVFTVQEEIGTRGAKAAAFTVNPDISMVLEATTACDIPGVEGAKQVCKLGEGAVVSYMDGGTIYDRELYNIAFEIAEKNNIKCQTKTMIAGGNDSGAIHKSVGGIRTIAVCVPCRYLHSPSCVVSENDLNSVALLSEKILERLWVL